MIKIGNVVEMPSGEIGVVVSRVRGQRTATVLCGDRTLQVSIDGLTVLHDTVQQLALSRIPQEIGRYILFMGSSAQPGGGWDDYAGAFGDLEQATHNADLQKESSRDESDFWGEFWAEVVDIHTGRLVARRGGQLVPPSPQWRFYNANS